MATNKLIRVITPGSDPEEFDLSRDGKLIYVSNEDVAKASIIDIAAAKVAKNFKVGRRPRDVAFLPDSSKAYVTRENDES